MSASRQRSRVRIGRRSENFREVRARFLIVCEDGKSAPNYFRDFRLSSAEIIPIGTGMSTLRLVAEAIRLREEKGLSAEKEAKDQTWVVMDRNSFPQDDYDNAFAKAQANNIRVAHSNECLEIWFLLHFEYTAASVARSKLPNLLSGHLGTTYSKGMEHLYAKLEHREEQAIQNALKLVTHHEKLSSAPLHNCRPSTTVYVLVQEMRKYTR